MRRAFAVLVGLLVVGVVSAADVDAKKLVGKWEITKSGGDAPVGSLVEFTKDGALNVLVKADGQELKISGKYTTAGDKLTVVLKIMDQESKEEMTVKKLTDDELELEDKDKKLDTLKRKK